MDRTNVDERHCASAQTELLASTQEFTVETRTDGTLTVSAEIPLHVNANDIPAIRVEHERLPDGAQRERFYLAEDSHVDFLVNVQGEVSFSAQNVCMTITRAGVVQFALKEGNR